MPRYSDDWLIDRVIFDYVAGGSCACCGLNHFLPNGTSDLINALTDLETDQAKSEIAALDDDRWPADLRDQVWSDRLRLRQKMKKDMADYSNFWCKHGEIFQGWCHDQDASFWRRHFQLPRSEILEVVRQQYDIHSAFGVVLCAEMEQVAFFHLTKYPPDGRGREEVNFERALRFSQQCGFTVSGIVLDGTPSKDVIDVWLQRMKSLGGPKLLQKGTKSDDGDADDVEQHAKKSSAGFSSDRRLIRLLIARYWAKSLQGKFLHALSSTKPEQS